MKQSNSTFIDTIRVDRVQINSYSTSNTRQTIKKENSTSIDMISNLPEELQRKILSYLPLKDVAATSILSKSWRSLWLSGRHPSLDYSIDDDDATRIPYLQFTKLVDAALSHPGSESEPIGRFRLESTRKNRIHPSSDLDRWIRAAKQRKVEILDLTWCINVKLTPNVLNCKTVTVLRLKCVKICRVKFGSVCLPSLKILHMKNVTFGSNREFHKFICGCRKNLEDLFLENVAERSWSSDTRWLCRRFPRLMRVYIQYVPMFLPFKAFKNAQAMQIPLDFHTPDDYATYFPKTTFHNLISLEIKCHQYKGGFLDDILKISPKLQNLIIYNKDEGFWSKSPQNYQHQCVASQLRTCCLKGFDSDKDKACVEPFAKYILENGKVLETMTISCITPPKTSWKNKLLSFPRSSPTCQVEFTTYVTKVMIDKMKDVLVENKSRSRNQKRKREIE